MLYDVKYLWEVKDLVLSDITQSSGYSCSCHSVRKWGARSGWCWTYLWLCLWSISWQSAIFLWSEKQKSLLVEALGQESVNHFCQGPGILLFPSGFSFHFPLGTTNTPCCTHIPFFSMWLSLLLSYCHCHLWNWLPHLHLHPWPLNLREVSFAMVWNAKEFTWIPSSYL
jgi:hypothetical protein